MTLPKMLMLAENGHPTANNDDDDYAHVSDGYTYKSDDGEADEYKNGVHKWI